MSGDIAMGSNKITGLAAADSNGDAVRFEQLPNVGSLARGWINFNGTGTVATRDSFNVSGLADNGTGDYTVSWATDFAAADYAVALAYSAEVNAQHTIVFVGNGTFGGAPTAGALNVVSFNAANSTQKADKAWLMIAAFGDQ